MAVLTRSLVPVTVAASAGGFLLPSFSCVDGSIRDLGLCDTAHGGLKACTGNCLLCVAWVFAGTLSTWPVVESQCSRGGRGSSLVASCNPPGALLSI